MPQREERVIPVPGGEVSAILDGPPDAADLLVLAHGAGAGMTHPFMESVAAGLAERGLRVARFNFLYMEAGKKAPDRKAVLEETYRSVLGALSDEGGRRFIGGKSMGGRIASQIAAGEDAVAVDGLVFLGYPLHPPGRPDRLRAEHLYDIEARMLFVEGTRDPFCPLDTLRPILDKMPAATELAVIDDGDHSLKVRKSSGRSSAEALEEAIDRVATWIGSG